MCEELHSLSSLRLWKAYNKEQELVQKLSLSLPVTAKQKQRNCFLWTSIKLAWYAKLVSRDVFWYTVPKKSSAHSWCLSSSHKSWDLLNRAHAWINGKRNSLRFYYYSNVDIRIKALAQIWFSWAWSGGQLWNNAVLTNEHDTRGKIIWQVTNVEQRYHLKSRPPEIWLTLLKSFMEDIE